MSTPLSGEALQLLTAQVAAQLGPPSIGEGFPNPVVALFQAGNTVVINSAGLFIYAGTPAAGNLLMSAAPAGGTDKFGNAYSQGETLVALAGLTSLFTVEDTSGNTLANIDSGGNITGQVINAGTDLLVGGSSVFSYMSNAQSGVLARGWTPGNTVTPWPSTAIVSGTAVAILELDFIAQAGRDYLLQVLSSTFILSVAPTANAQYVQRLLYTTDGTTPTISSTELSGHSPCIVPVLATTILNYPTPYMEFVLPVPVSATPYRFLLAAYITGGIASFKYSNSMEMRVTDLGADTGQFNNAGVVFGTGGTGGSGGKQTYTETFYPATTRAYRTDGGLQNTNNDMLHGSYSGEPGYAYSYINWAAGSLGNNLNTVLGSGYQINSVYLRLNNLHSWYNSGMTFGIHSSTSLGGAVGTYSGLLGSHFISEGATTSFRLSSAEYSPFGAGGVTYMVLGPDAGNEFNLSWYGFFYGGGGSTSYMPKLTINYTH